MSRTSLLLLYVFSIVTPLFAQKNLDTLLTLAMRDNLTILQAETKAKAADLAIQSSSALPDPVLMIEARGIPQTLDLQETSETMFMFEQTLPFPGKINNKKNKAKYTATTEAERIKLSKRMVKKNLVQLYAQLFKTDNFIMLNQKNREISDKLQKIIKEQYILSLTSQQSMIKIDLEITRLLIEREKLYQNRQSIVAGINNLIQQNKEFPPGYAELSVNIRSLEINTQEISQRLKKENPTLQAIQQQISSNKIDVKLAALGNKPDFKLMGGYMLMNNMDDMYMARVGMTLPFLPWSNKDAKYGRETAMVNVNYFEKVYQNELQRQQFIVDKTIKILNSMATESQLYKKELLGTGQSQIEAVLLSYQNGKSDFLLVLQTIKDLYNMQKDYYSLIADYNINHAELEFFLGDLSQL